MTEQDCITANSRVNMPFCIGILQEQKEMTETLYQSFSHFMAEAVGFEDSEGMISGAAGYHAVRRIPEIRVFCEAMYHEIPCFATVVVV